MSWFAFLMAILFLAIGFICAFFAHKVLKINNSALFSSLFFAPILAYMVFSGQIAEFKGFGIEAKLRDASKKKIEIKVGTISNLLSGTNYGELQSFLSGGSEVVLLNSNQASKHSKNPWRLAFSIAEQISVNLLQGKFELLVVVDGQRRVIGSFAKHWFMDIPSIPDVHVSRGNDKDFDQTDEKRIKSNLSKTLLWDILLKPLERTKEWGLTATISKSATQINALRELNRHSIDALPVVDGDGKYQGIVRRSDIETAILDPLMNVLASG